MTMLSGSLYLEIFRQVLTICLDQVTAKAAIYRLHDLLPWKLKCPEATRRERLQQCTERVYTCQ